MTLRRQMIDLVRLNVVYQSQEIGRVGSIAVVQKETHSIKVRIFVEVIDAPGIKRRSATDNSVNLISLF